MSGKKCSDCRLCKMKDEGYSNYTVEGTTVECLANEHPNGKFDNWYGEDWRMHYANWCKKFTPGCAIHFSVEGDLL